MPWSRQIGSHPRCAAECSVHECEQALVTAIFLHLCDLCAESRFVGLGVLGSLARSRDEIGGGDVIARILINNGEIARGWTWLPIQRHAELRGNKLPCLYCLIGGLEERRCVTVGDLSEDRLVAPIDTHSLCESAFALLYG